MELKKKVSILMPSLNVRPYVEECMDSVVGQTYSELEILVVDAGSTDGTLEALEQYAKIDKRIKIFHSFKKSYGYQMNLALEMATGEYVAIVETDDYIADDMIETLLSVAEQRKVDYVKGFAKTITLSESGEYIISNTDRYIMKKGYAGRILDVSQMPELLLYDIFHWCGIYKREFLNNIRFNETPGAAFQDQGFLLKTLSSAKRAVYIEKPIYYYRLMNQNSSTYSPQGFHYIYNEYQMNYKYVMSLERDWISFFYERMFIQVCGRYNSMYLSGHFWDEALEDINKIRLWLSDVVGNGYLTRERTGFEIWKKLLLFLENPRLLYEYICDSRMFDIRRGIPKLVKSKYIWIYGAGKLGSQVMRQLAQSKVKDKLCGYVVSEKVENVSVDNYPIKGIGEIETVSEETLFVIALSCKYHDDVLNMLYENRFNNYVIWDEELLKN